MRRRIFVGGAFGAPALTLGAPSKAQDIPRRVFGKTGERLTIIGQAGGRLPMIDAEAAKAVVRRAVDLGVNYFDCAHAYGKGRSEEIFGAVLPAVRKHVFITTKSEVRDRQGATTALEESLKRLKTDYVDLWQIHAVSSMKEVDQIFAPGGAIAAFEAAKKSGKCRFIGFTGHTDPAVHLEMLKRYSNYDTILMPLHVADPAWQSFEKQVLPKAVELGLGIQGMKSTANAKLLSVFSLAECLRYALSLPIHCLAVGCTTIGQIEDDARIASSFSPFSTDEMTALRARAERVKGPTLEDWKRDPARAGLQPPYAGG